MISNDRILIVEDSERYADIIRFFCPGKMEIDIASSAEDAVELGGTVSYRMAIIDIRLDDSSADNMDGLRVIEYLASLEVKPVIIATSAYAAGEVRLGALAQGADRFIPKPYRPDQLTTALREALGA